MPGLDLIERSATPDQLQDENHHMTACISHGMNFEKAILLRVLGSLNIYPIYVVTYRTLISGCPMSSFDHAMLAVACNLTVEPKVGRVRK